MLAVWSTESVRSEFVRTEASRARRRRALVPVRIDDIEPPVEFERVPAADLMDWMRAPGMSLPSVLLLEVTRRVAAAAPIDPPSLDSPGAVPAIDGDDAAGISAGYSLQQAVTRIRELVAAGKAVMGEWFATQEALRVSQTACKALAAEFKSAREALARIGQEPQEPQAANQASTTSTSDGSNSRGE